ncbi:hypothetical protein MSG_01677 [Mycobacterium shigaense]|uniref:Uncharacterized protein n=1 Tax=Mycobacterium shigaense TaxID=722731 RepID=A0A1Z4EFT1_9MYCO|nr:hypothetical protein MSG_01677 [Mycobacterium shigaense]
MMPRIFASTSNGFTPPHSVRDGAYGGIVETPRSAPMVTVLAAITVHLRTAVAPDLRRRPGSYSRLGSL